MARVAAHAKANGKKRIARWQEKRSPKKSKNSCKDLRFFVLSLQKGNYSAIALHLNPRLKYTAKRPIKRQNKVSIFLAYVRYFLYLYTYERASYGHIKSAARHDGRDAVDA